MNPIDTVLGVFRDAKPSGRSKWSARCPAHDDRHASLGFGVFPDGGVWIKCHAGCSEIEILNAIGLSKEAIRPRTARTPMHQQQKDTKPTQRFDTLDLAVESATKRLRAAAGERWVYTTDQGEEVLWMVRFDYPGQEGQKRKKEFRPYHHDGLGWVEKDPPGLSPLYRLPHIAAATTILLLEGERKADLAARLGYAATTSVHGSQAAAKSDWRPLVRKDVIVFPDNDHAGKKYASDACVRLAQLSATGRFKVVTLPDLPAKGDLVDFVAMRTASGKSEDEIKAEIDTLIDATPWASVGSVSASSRDSLDSGVGGWPEPQPLPCLALPVAAFDPAWLPESFQPWVIDIADRMQCPIDFVAVAAMVALSGVVGRRVGIRPKRHDPWLVVPNLWGGVVGRPSGMKSPALKEALSPLYGLEKRAKAEYEAKAKENAAIKLIEKAKEKKTFTQIREALDEENGEEKAMEIARESLDGDAEPIRTRYIVNDTTVEKLGEILNQNPSGVVVVRDELVGFLKSLEREGHDNDRPFYLEAWSGINPFVFDRIGRGTIDIESTCVAIIGGIQPGPLGQYLRSMDRGGAGDDGFLQRFQLMVCPDLSKDWVNVDRPSDPEAQRSVFQVFEGLARIDAILLGADVDPQKDHGIGFLRFDEAAQGEFDAWREGLELHLRSDVEHSAMEAHLGKFRSLIPSLALLLHLADGGKNPIGVGPLRKAIAWSDYLATHARRIYAQATHADVGAGRELAKKILAGQVPDGFAFRDVQRKGWAGLSTSETVKDAVQLLIDFGWLIETQQPTLGRTATQHWINPGLQGSEAAKSVLNPSDGTDKADRRGGEGASVSSVSDQSGKSPESEGEVLP